MNRAPTTGMAAKKKPNARKHKVLIEHLGTVWDDACTLELHRTSPCGIYSGPLDRGVNYFVLMLEQLGAVPQYSCEGHPTGFYVMFHGSLQLAERIRECGFFTVELEGHEKWSIRTRCFETDKERKQVLRWAAQSWEETLGPCTVLSR